MNKTQLIEDLKKTGVKTGDLLLVHTSLSKVGHLENGPQDLIDALKETITESGTIVMPAFNETSSYNPNPGIVSETFRKNPDVINSNHPAANYAVWGKDAEEIAGKIILSNDGLSFENGKSSPLYRLYQKDARVLMIGTDYSTCTAFHLAENLSSWPSKKIFTETVTFKDAGTFTIQDIAYESSDFPVIGTAIENRFWGDEDVIHFGKTGNAETRLINFKLLVDYAADWMHKNRK